MKKLSKWLKGTYNRIFRKDEGGSYSLREKALLNEFREDPNNTFLVSFPRTGSHWLRMLMELYFEKPSLTRAFFYPEADEYLTLHVHDKDLQVRRRRVIYLYREPVATIYSQLQYEEEDLDDEDRIAYWSDLYGRHLHKWLVTEEFVDQKTVVCYDRMKRDLNGEFAKVCDHFSVAFEKERFETVADRVSKRKVEKKTKHDPNVVQISETYEERRDRFRNERGELVWDCVLDGRPELEPYFDTSS